MGNISVKRGRTTTKSQVSQWLVQPALGIQEIGTSRCAPSLTLMKPCSTFTPSDSLQFCLLPSAVKLTVCSQVMLTGKDRTPGVVSLWKKHCIIKKAHEGTSKRGNGAGDRLDIAGKDTNVDP